MTTFKDLEPLVAAMVPGAPSEIVARSLLSAARAFCQATETYWAEELGLAPVSEELNRTFSLSPPADTELLNVVEATLGSVDLRQVTDGYKVKYQSNEICVLRDNSQMESLDVIYAVQPSYTATDIPEISPYLEEALICKASADLLISGYPWANPEIGSAQLQMYSSLMVRSRALEAKRRYMGGAPAVRLQEFGA